MAYLKEFITQINQRNFPQFATLWEEYVMSDSVDFEELNQLLKTVKASDFSTAFGEIVEKLLPLWKTIQNKEESYAILSLIIDLQTTQSKELAELAQETLKTKYGSDPKFQDYLRIAGLRQKENFQNALSKFDLLAHLKKNNAVFHAGGWGTGEIIDVSFVRENLSIEFENISGKKDLSFENAFKVLVPLKSDHFLARRFCDADQLEKEGKEDPVALVKLLLRDIGPKTAGEIKDELSGLVIPEKEWTKWWQNARGKLKKDSLISSPESLKEPFKLLSTEFSPEEKLKKSLEQTKNPHDVLQLIYSFVRDQPVALKNEELKHTLEQTLWNLLEQADLPQSLRFEILILLDEFFGNGKAKEQASKFIQDYVHIDALIEGIETIALKKRALISLKEERKDWQPLYLKLLLTVSQGPLRDFLLKELSESSHKAELESLLETVMQTPQKSPEFFVWYFQKLTGDNDSAAFKNDKGLVVAFEAFFVLMHAIENKQEWRDLLKKMYNLFANKRYALVRDLLKLTSLESAKELLLLVSKCHSLSDQDKTVFKSLVEVVHPSLGGPKKENADTEEEIWTTEAGFLKIQERIRQIGTVEVVENAKEIEAARALGDLRENSEFKFAQERRARLQSELKTLSDQLKKARIITPEDIHQDEVGVGSRVCLKEKNGQKSAFLILGPWDADPEKNILSLNSKFAQAMLGKKQGETFSFRDEHFEVESLGSFFNQ